MKSAGEVVRADVATRDDGKSRGFGTVTFTDPKAAAKAIRTLNDTELEGRTIAVRQDEGRGGGGGRSGGREERSYGGRSGGGRPYMDAEGEDSMYSGSGVQGRNGWVKPSLEGFVDDGPPPEPKGSLLR